MDSDPSQRNIRCRSRLRAPAQLTRTRSPARGSRSGKVAISSVPRKQSMRSTGAVPATLTLIRGAASASNAAPTGWPSALASTWMRAPEVP